MRLLEMASIRTALVFRSSPPQPVDNGNVRALAIRDLVANKPVDCAELPRISVEDNYLSHCLHPGDVVIPSRGDYYKAWLFEGANEPVFPLGQLNIISVKPGLDARYLVWYLNQASTQALIGSRLTGTTIKALTKSALLDLDMQVPSLGKQKVIAEVDRIALRIAAIRLRLNELDKEETAHLTRLYLHKEEQHG